MDIFVLCNVGACNARPYNYSLLRSAPSVTAKMPCHLPRKQVSGEAFIGRTRGSAPTTVTEMLVISATSATSPASGEGFKCKNSPGVCEEE